MGMSAPLKLAGNATVLVAGSILITGALIAVGVLFLGATAVVMLRRMRWSTPQRSADGGKGAA
jgi:hypothetical protein